MEKVLVYNLNPYITRSSLVHLIKKLSKKRKVYLVTSSDNMSNNNYKYLLNLKKIKIIKKLIIVPSFWNHVGVKNFFNFIIFYKSIKYYFNLKYYDLVLFCCGDHEVDNFFLSGYYNNLNLVQYIPFYSNRYLFTNYNLCKKFFKNKEIYNNFNSYKIPRYSIFNNLIFKNSLKKLIQKFLDKFFFKIYFNICLKIIFFLFKKEIVNQIFEEDLFKKYNFSSTAFSKSICFNEVQKIIGKKLYPNNKFYVASPSYLRKINKTINFRNNNMLLLIGWYIGENNVKIEIINNIKYLTNIYNIKNIFIKSHPSFDNKSVLDLSNEIKKIGVKTILLDSSQPVTEIKKNFKIVSGFASHALIEAKYSFPNSIIICLDKADAISPKFRNPPARLALGCIYKKKNHIFFLSDILKKKKYSINKFDYKPEIYFINKFIKNIKKNQKLN
jgi:hypothetical protein